MIRLYTSI